MISYGLVFSDYIHKMGQAGTFFKWNPYVVSGLPTVASSMGVVFYPLNLFFILLHPLKWMFYFFILHQMLAGVFAFIYLRGNRFSPPACLVGAFLYAFSAVKLFYATNIEHYGIFTFTPLILFCIDRLTEDFRWSWVGWLSLALSVVVLSGSMHFILIFLAVYVLYAGWRTRGKIKTLTWRAPAAFLLTAIITGGLCAILIFPLLTLYGQGLMRSVPFDYHFATLSSLDPKLSSLMVFGNFYGQLGDFASRFGREQYSFVLGPWGFMLATVAILFNRKRRRLLFFFLAIAGVGIFLGAGRYNPVYKYLFKYIWYFGRFRAPSRFLALFLFLVPYSAAAGVEIFFLFSKKYSLIPQFLKSRMKKTATGVIIFFVFYYLFFLFAGARGNIKAHVLLAVLIAGCGAFIFVTSRNKLKLILPAVLLLSFLNILDPFVFVEKEFFINNRFIKAEQNFLHSMGEKLPQKHSKIFYSIYPSAPQLAGISNISGNATLDLRLYAVYFYSAITGKRIPEKDYSAIMHMGFHPLAILIGNMEKGLKSINQQIKEADWDAIYRENIKGNPMYRMLCPVFTILPGKYYREEDPYPRFWFSKSYKIIKNEDAVFREMLKKNFDPENFVILNKKPGKEFSQLESDENIDRKNWGEIIGFEPDRVVIRFNNANTRGWLTVSDKFYPGWKAYVDGKKRPIYRGNLIFKTIPILPGDRKLILKYEPQDLKTGAFISATTLAGVLIFLLVHFLIKDKNKTPGNPD